MTKLLWLDEYERVARLAPGLIALLPFPVLVIAFGLRDNPVVAALLSLVVAVGGPMLIAKYVRSRGRSLEGRLYREWGAPPTTLLLTPTSAGFVDAVQAQRRASVERVSQQNLPLTPLPNDSSAQQIYKAAIATIRQKTYSHDAFPLVFAENKSYGFERNTLAIRAEGLAISVVGLVVAIFGWRRAASGHLSANPSALLGAAIIILLLVAFWIIWPTKRRVRSAANLYAEQLLDAAAGL
jgi:hypothetical protein